MKDDDFSTRCFVRALGFFLKEGTGIAITMQEGNFVVYNMNGIITIQEEDCSYSDGQLLIMIDEGSVN